MTGSIFGCVFISQYVDYNKDQSQQMMGVLDACPRTYTSQIVEVVGPSHSHVILIFYATAEA